MSDDDLKQLIDSNAKGIQALTNMVNKQKKEKKTLSILSKNRLSAI